MSNPVYFPFEGNPEIPAGKAVLAPLMLARFDEPEIELVWASTGFAIANFKARELPPELTIPEGETLGTTLGALAPRAWLYEFTKAFPSATVVQRFTSYETDLVFGGETYAAKRINHGEIRQGGDLGRDEITIDVDGLDVSPLLDAALLRVEVPLMVTVRAAQITSPGNAGSGTVAWSGEVVSAKVRGKRITSKAVSAGMTLDRKIPRFYLQPGCNHTVYSPGCGLDYPAWAHTATLSDPGTIGWPFSLSLSSLVRAGGAELTAQGSFAGGWLESGSGANLQRVPIVGSTEVVAGTLTVTLSRDPAPWLTAGATVKIYPGCNGKRATCKDRFDNYLNFGGHPFVPQGNPSLIKLSKNAGGGGKK